MNGQFRALATVCCLLASTSVHAQSLAAASEAAKKIPHTWPQSTVGAPDKVYTNADVQAAPDTGPATFVPTKDNVFVCTARSIKALFKVVSAEHHGYFVQQFADVKLRDNPDLLTAAKADTASCEKGAYIGAMEKALKAAALESEHTRELLKRVP